MRRSSAAALDRLVSCSCLLLALGAFCAWAAGYRPAIAWVRPAWLAPPAAARKPGLAPPAAASGRMRPPTSGPAAVLRHAGGLVWLVPIAPRPNASLPPPVGPAPPVDANLVEVAGAPLASPPRGAEDPGAGEGGAGGSTSAGDSVVYRRTRR